MEDDGWEKYVMENARGVRIQMINKTDMRFVLVLGLNHTGDWAKEPPSSISAKGMVSFGCVAQVWMSGTEGEIVFSTGRDTLKVSWVNPYSALWGKAAVQAVTSDKILVNVQQKLETTKTGYVLVAKCEICMADEELKQKAKEEKRKAKEELKKKDVGLVGSIKENYEKLIQAFIRPPRHTYRIEELGPKKFLLNEAVPCTREDFVIENKFKLKLQCSWFEMDDNANNQKPCIIYCHANSGSRVNALQIVRAVLPFGYSVFAFDFGGSGLSEGEYVTLGSREHKDIECVVKYIKSQNKASKIALWGRSMGAVSSLLYGKLDTDIAAIVADSAFSDLPLLCEQLVAAQGDNSSSPAQARQIAKLPSFIVRGGLYVISSSIESRCDLNIYDVSPIKCVPYMLTPIVFIHGSKDTMVNISHSEALFQSYAGEDKKLLVCEQGHNSARPPEIIEQVVKFLQVKLQGSLLDFALVRKSWTEEEVEPALSPRFDPESIDSKYF